MSYRKDTMSGKTTRLKIANSLKELAKTKPLEKISVSDIISASQVNRSTFYYHFIDKDAVIEFIYESDFNKVSSERTTGYWIVDHQSIFRVIKNDIAFYQQAVKISSPNSFRHILFKQIYASIERFIYEQLKGRPLTDESRNFICRFYAISHTDRIIQYINDGAKEDYSKIARFLMWCTEPSLSRTIENFLIFESHA